MHQNRSPNDLSIGKLGWLITTLLLVAFGLRTIQWYNANLNLERMAPECHERVKQTIDPEVLRSWAFRILNRDPHTNNAGPPERLPGLDAVRRGETPAIAIGSYRDEEQKYICVTWAGALHRGQWGLAIGSPTFVLPQYGGWRSRAWKPGIYFWQTID